MANPLRQLGFGGQLQAFADVADDFLSGLLRRDAVVGVRAVLIFGEENRRIELAYVVIQGACTHKLHVGAYGTSRLGSHGRHLHGVLEGAGCLFRQAPQQRIVDVAELHKGYGGGEAENLLYEQDEEVSQ